SDISWVTRAVRPNVNEVIVDYNFPTGLCRFSSKGKRINSTVNLEIQWRKIGDTEWKGGIPYIEYSGQIFNAPQVKTLNTNRNDIIVINSSTGQLSYISGPETSLVRLPPVPAGTLKIADVIAKTTRVG